MSFSRLHAPPKHMAEWDESGDVTLQLCDLMPSSSRGAGEEGPPWAEDVDLDEALLGGDLLSAQGDLEGNFFHQPVLNPPRHDRQSTSSSNKRPSAEDHRRDRPTEGKRSRKSTHRSSTSRPDLLPTPSPEPLTTPGKPRERSQQSSRSREASTSTVPIASHAGLATVNNAAPSSSRAVVDVGPPSPPLLTIEAVEEAPSSRLDVLSWRNETEHQAVRQGRQARELDPVHEASSSAHRQSIANVHSYDDDGPSRSSSQKARSSLTLSGQPTWEASSSSRATTLPRPDALVRRTSSVHSTTSVTLSTFKTSAIIQPQPRSNDLLSRSTSSSSSSLAGLSRSYLATQPAKDDLYERKKRDSYIGPNGVLGPEQDSEPPSPPRAVRPRVAGKDRRRVGAQAVGGKRIEKPSHRRNKSPPLAPKELPIQALECLVAKDDERPVAASSSGVKAMDFFRSFLQTINPAAPSTATAPSPASVPSVASEQEISRTQTELPGSISATLVSNEPASEADPDSPPPRLPIRPPTPPRRRPDQPTCKPSALPPSSRPTSFSRPNPVTTSRQPLQQTTQRSTNLPRAPPLGPPTTVPSKSRVVSAPHAFRSSRPASTATTAPKPFNLLTTSLSSRDTHPVERPFTSAASSSSTRGTMPDYSAAHDQMRKLELARQRQKEELRARKEEEVKRAKVACEAGAARRKEREKWEEEKRIEREQGERKRLIEEKVRLAREREAIRLEREATVVKANPVPEMHRSLRRV